MCDNKAREIELRTPVPVKNVGCLMHAQDFLFAVEIPFVDGV